MCIRDRVRGMGKKKAKRTKTPLEKKKPRGGERVDAVGNLLIAWRIQDLDPEGGWGWQSIKYVLPCANKHRMASSMNLNRILEKNPHIRRDQLEDGLEFSEQIRPAGVKPGVEKRVNSKRV